MKKIFKRILNLALAFTMFCTLISVNTLSVSAKNNEEAPASDILTKNEETVGTSALNLDSLFSPMVVASQNNAPKLSNVKLSYKNNKLIFTGKLYDGKISVDLVSSGEFYKNEKTENANIYENMILSDMCDSGNIHFVQFKIDKDNLCINIILQNKNTSELMEFKVSIDESVFNNIYNSYENSLSGIELERKIIELNSVSKNLINPPSTSTTTVEGVHAMTNINSNGASRATYNGWMRLINDLNRYGSVKLGNYSDINASFLKGAGWKYDNNNSNAPYTFACYSQKNGTYNYTSQFALVDIVNQSYYVSDTKWFAGTQAKYVDGMIVNYNTLDDKLTVQYYGWGLDLNKFELGLNGLTNKAVFINRSVNKKTESGGSIAKAAICLSSTASTISDVWTGIQPYTNQSINYTELFDQTYSAQYNRYNGKVIRGIAESSGTEYLNKPGHFLNVSGTMSYSVGTSTSWWNGYKYTCRTAI
ncbi:hypothetical protein [Clostridium baratii]|uniref:hypothetical protein n=1 Tax=Clostridium baratii TaxID=1561 RepID=UPI0005F2AA13|nr:hypothetical protein [Clostridium baratii]KJU70399.1 hypothetical protein UC77_15085 [Clostridium baratii]